MYLKSRAVCESCRHAAGFAYDAPMGMRMVNCEDPRRYRLADFDDDSILDDDPDECPRLAAVRCGLRAALAAR